MRTPRKAKAKPAPAEPTYTWKDRQGVRWRWSGSRPVSEIADKVVREAQLKPIP